MFFSIFALKNIRNLGAEESSHTHTSSPLDIWVVLSAIVALMDVLFGVGQL